MRLSLLLLLLPWAAPAQELPPPGGWPLRPVTELRAVPEPPGGLVPYRHGALWGFADTTGRVWIRPVFETEPPRFGAGLLLRAESSTDQRQQASKQQLPPQKTYLPDWNLRYGLLFPKEDGTHTWALSFREPSHAGPAFLLNAHGEQLLAQPHQAIASTADGGWQAMSRPTRATAQREIMAIEASDAEPALRRPGHLFTLPLRPEPPAVPTRLVDRTYDLDADFTDFEAPFFEADPLYLARRVDGLRPRRLVTVTGDGMRRQVEDTRYLHDGHFALFDAQGKQLTQHRYSGMRPLLPRRLAYSQRIGNGYLDREIVDSSGVSQSWQLTNSNYDGATPRYGLLDRQGHEITPPLYFRIEAVGLNSLWVVAIRQNRLHYGLIDTMGRAVLPLSPCPISLPDAAGLLRQYSHAPLPTLDPYGDSYSPARYPDSATVRYLRPDGRPAFAGRFTQADAFWQGRALVRQGQQYGLLDAQGRWVLPLQPEQLSYFGYDKDHHALWAAVDPLDLFGHLNGEAPHRLRAWEYRSGVLPGNPLLLLAHGPGGYGLRDVQTGQVMVPAVFDQRPRPWYGGVVGQQKGQPLGYSFLGQTFTPVQPATYPAGVREPKPNYGPYRRPLLQRTEQGWRTRGGHQLWQD